jgi:hypothetical protein
MWVCTVRSHETIHESRKLAAIRLWRCVNVVKHDPAQAADYVWTAAAAGDLPPLPDQLCIVIFRGHRGVLKFGPALLYLLFVLREFLAKPRVDPPQG